MEFAISMQLAGTQLGVIIHTQAMIVIRALIRSTAMEILQRQKIRHVRTVPLDTTAPQLVRHQKFAHQAGLGQVQGKIQPVRLPLLDITHYFQRIKIIAAQPVITALR